MYGLGSGEAEVGAVLGRRTDESTIATKVGIRPTPVGRVAGVAQPPIRALLRRASGLQHAVKASGGSPETGLVGRLLYTRQPLDAAHLQRSLDRSRTALGRDRLDLWLLHDPVAMDDATAAAVIGFLDAARERGAITAWGVAANFRTADPSMLGVARAADAVQYPYDLPRGHQDQRNLGAAARYTFGCLAQALPLVGELLGAHPDLKARCDVLLDADSTRPDVLAGFLVRDALRANPTGKILYSTTNTHHLHDVLAHADRLGCTEAEDAEVAKLVTARLEGHVRDR